MKIASWSGSGGGHPLDVDTTQQSRASNQQELGEVWSWQPWCSSEPPKSHLQNSALPWVLGSYLQGLDKLFPGA